MAKKLAVGQTSPSRRGCARDAIAVDVHVGIDIHESIRSAGRVKADRFER
jgi:hypothetical protein